jgi:hypothetical protein
MCATKTQLQFNQTASISKKRLIGYVAVSQLIFAFIFLLAMGMPSFLSAQFPISVSASGTTDYTIPAGFNSINVTVRGAAGGSCRVAGCAETAWGGKGAVFNARFFVDNIFCPSISLESGGTPGLLLVLGGINYGDLGAGGAEVQLSV